MKSVFIILVASALLCACAHRGHYHHPQSTPCNCAQDFDALELFDNGCLKPALKEAYQNLDISAMDDDADACITPREWEIFWSSDLASEI